MSVINQMLKDLEQRQGEKQPHDSAVGMAVPAKQSNFKTLLLILITVAITLFAVYFLQLQNENERLKTVNESHQIAVKSAVTAEPITNSEAGKLTVQVPSEAEVINTVKPSSQAAVYVEQQNIVTPEADKPFDTTVDATKNQPVEVEKYSKNETTPVINKQLAQKSAADEQRHTSLEAQKKQQAQTPAPVKVKQTSTTQLPITREEKAPASMVISRKQLEPEALAKQKMQRAKQALANNQISDAEAYFEDILIILPSEKDARKQLAALWFGRQAYQPAVNLLSQGISLDPEDTELRVLQAQIYSKNNANYQAFKALQSHPYLSEIDDINYLSMLATQAQASKQFTEAASAYKKLTLLQPTIGRWWLGLGIAYDSDAKFKMASQTYQMAISQLNLSDSAKQFVSQRLKELGEQ